tara:strand:+ start:141 stop:308 length:168 start_codon:yes stop_codon:yes gene_type:complete
MAEKKATKKAAPKKEVISKYKITKSNGKVIYREGKNAGEIKLARMKSKGWKVEGV